MQEEESERRVVVVTANGSVLRPWMEQDGLLMRSWFLLVVSLCSVVLLFVRCPVAVVALAVCVFSVLFVVGPHDARISVAHPCVSGLLSAFLCFQCFCNVATSA